MFYTQGMASKTRYKYIIHDIQKYLATRAQRYDVACSFASLAFFAALTSSFNFRPASILLCFAVVC
jgi:hypothetical protein